MGCDIHVHAEHQIMGPDRKPMWEMLERPEIELYYYPDTMRAPAMGHYWYWGRNYNLFSMLADVRNGTKPGTTPPAWKSLFGGDLDAEDDWIEPISEPRGLPDDVTPAIKAESDEWGIDGHSHSWFTLAELQSVDWERPITLRGWVNAREYLNWKAEGSPNSWCAAVGGGGVRHLTHDQMDAALAAGDTDGAYAKVEWTRTWREAAGPDWFECLERLAKFTHDDGNDVRIIFWFDN